MLNTHRVGCDNHQSFCTNRQFVGKAGYQCERYTKQNKHQKQHEQDVTNDLVCLSSCNNLWIFAMEVFLYQLDVAFATFNLVDGKLAEVCKQNGKHHQETSHTDGCDRQCDNLLLRHS